MPSIFVPSSHLNLIRNQIRRGAHVDESAIESDLEDHQIRPCMPSIFIPSSRLNLIRNQDQINDHMKKLKDSEGESSYKSLTDNVLSMAIVNKEGRGRLRGCSSLISSTEYKSSSHARAKLRKMDGQHNVNEEKMLSKISDVVDQRLTELIPDIIAAIKHANVQGTRASQSYKPGASSFEVRNKQPEPTTYEFPDNTPVELVGWMGDVVGKGKVARLGATECHGVKIDFNVEEKVSVTVVVNPDEPVYKANSFADTLGDVGKNGFLIWPKMFLKYNP